MDYIVTAYVVFRNILWLNIIFAILLVFFERRTTTTWLWLMVLTFYQVLVFLLYLFIGQDMSKEDVSTERRGR